jgi:enoyl-CoA hydratase/carnithine racemase
VADLEYTIADGIGTILLNRPHRKNAFTLEMIDEWARILTEARTDPDVRVIVLTGDFIDAEEAARLGIANHVVDDDDLPAAVNTLARKLADAPPSPFA